MNRLKIKKKAGLVPLSTASLPDIVFILLFFFMVATVIKPSNLMVKIDPPEASNAKRLGKRSLISYVYVGVPVKSGAGDQPRIQINDYFVDVKKAKQTIAEIIDRYLHEDQAFVSFSIKADSNISMGIITDLKQELRKANALKISYLARKRD